MIAFANPIAAAIAVAVFAVFVWALRGHFASVSVPLGMWLVSGTSVCTLAAFLVGLVTTPPSLAQLAIGTVVQLGSLALFAAAFHCTRQRRITLAFDPDQPTFLVKGGVYRHLRHPFNVSYLLFWAGCCIKVPAPEVMAGTTALFLLYVRAALAEEQKFAASSLAGAYLDYQIEAGFFWPKRLRQRARS